MVEDTLKSHRSMAFDLLTLPQNLHRTVEKQTCEAFHASLPYLAQVCNSETSENLWLRDVFTLSFANSDLRKEFLKENLDSAQGLELAINMEKRKFKQISASFI